MNSSSLPILLLLLLSVFIAEAFAFTPIVGHSSSLKYQQWTVVHSTFTTYKDWHASLHPLDDFGVDDDIGSLYNTPRVGRGAANAHTPAMRPADGGLMAEIARAFLPVAILIMLEITLKV